MRLIAGKIQYDSGENNKSMILVSVLFTLIAESCSSCRYRSHQNGYLKLQKDIKAVSAHINVRESLVNC